MSSNNSHLFVFGRKIDEVQHTFNLNDVPSPNSDRCGWDAYKLLDLARLTIKVRGVWPAQTTPITRARLLVTLLADGSFAFLDSERLRCRDGLSEAHVEELLHTYKICGIPYLREVQSISGRKFTRYVTYSATMRG